MLIMRMVLKIRKWKGELLMLVKIVVTIGIIAVFFYIRNSVKKWSREWNMKEIAGKKSR